MVYIRKRYDMLRSRCCRTLTYAEDPMMSHSGCVASQSYCDADGYASMWLSVPCPALGRILRKSPAVHQIKQMLEIYDEGGIAALALLKDDGKEWSHPCGQGHKACIGEHLPPVANPAWIGPPPSMYRENHRANMRRIPCHMYALHERSGETFPFRRCSKVGCSSYSETGNQCLQVWYCRETIQAPPIESDNEENQYYRMRFLAPRTRTDRRTAQNA
jgi:hypothetical protein